MARCCTGSGQCACTITAEPSDGCNPVGVTVSGAGTSLNPFVIGTTWDPSLALRLDGNEPWTTETVEGCEIIVPREQYLVHPAQVMCDGTGDFVGYAFIVLDGVLGTEIIRYQALDTTTLQTSLPSGWEFCCPQQSGDMISMCTAAAVEGDPDDLVGWAMIRYDIETGTYQQQYINLAGTITTTLPTNWIPCGCGDSEAAGGGDPDVTLTENYIVIAVAISALASAATTLTDQAAAEGFMASDARTTTLFDLTDWEEVRLVARKPATAGATNSKLVAQYSTVNPGSAFVGADWSDLGASEVSVALNTTHTVLASSWISVTALARDDVYLAVTSIGGDGALDPTVGNIYLQFRRQVVTDVVVEGGGGGGGGGDQATGDYPLRVGVDGVVEGAFYPDWGLPGIAEADAVDIFRLPDGFTTATWLNVTATLHNVTVAPSDDVVVVLRNVTDAADIATITIPAATSPTSNRIVADVAGSGTASDEDALQWQITSAPADNAYGLAIDAFYELS